MRVAKISRCYSARSAPFTVLASALARATLGITLYPNPATKAFTIDAVGSPETRFLSIQVLDNIGRVVYETDGKKRMRMEVPAPPSPGLYVVRIQTSAGLTIRRLTVVP